MNQNHHHPHIQYLNSPVFEAAGVSVAVYRLDLAHPDYSGNKYYKLKDLAQRIALAKQNTVVSFGGRWSNHLLALSQYGKDHGIATIGIVRDVAAVGATPLLNRCKANSMRIDYVDALMYRNRNNAPEQVLSALALPNTVYLLPEGGSSPEAIAGCADIVTELRQAVGACDHIIVPVGSGATMAGVVKASTNNCTVHGVAVTKKYAEQEALVRDSVASVQASCRWSISRLPELGDYGQLQPPLIDFIHNFEREYDIPLDPNYTAKAFYWFYQALHASKFCCGDSVVLLHTGGLLGRLGYPAVFSA